MSTRVESKSPHLQAGFLLLLFWVLGLICSTAVGYRRTYSQLQEQRQERGQQLVHTISKSKVSSILTEVETTDAKMVKSEFMAEGLCSLNGRQGDLSTQRQATVDPPRANQPQAQRQITAVDIRSITMLHFQFLSSPRSQIFAVLGDAIFELAGMNEPVSRVAAATADVKSTVVE